MIRWDVRGLFSGPVRVGKTCCVLMYSVDDWDQWCAYWSSCPGLYGVSGTSYHY